MKKSTNKSTNKGKNTNKKDTKTISSKKTEKKVISKEKDIKKEEPKKKVKQLSIEEVIDEDIIEETEEIKETPKKKKEKKKVKTSDLLLIIGVVAVVIIGLLAMKGEKAKPNYTLPLSLEGESGLQLLSYADYQTKIDNKESFVVVLSRESCSHCANFIPVAKEFASEQKVPMYYVDTDTFSQEEWTTFEKSNTFLTKSKGNWGTPTTVVLAGNEAVDYIEGETTKENLLNLYKEYFKMEQ